MEHICSQCCLGPRPVLMGDSYLFEKLILMGKGPSIYTSNFKHIGPLQIIVDKKESTVVSVLGIRTFSFAKLPSNRDNRYAVLKYALKAYFCSLFENFDDLGRQERTGTGFLGILRSMVSPLALGSGDFMDVLKGRVCKDYKLFNWESIGNFYEIQNGDNILLSLARPALVEVVGDHQLVQGILDEDCVKQTGSGTEIEKSTLLERFVTGEVCFFDRIQEYRNELLIHMEFNEDMKRRDLANFFKVVDSYHAVVSSFAKRFCGYFGRRGMLSAKETLFKYKLVHDADCDPCSYESVAAFYIENFHHFSSYIEFVADYDDVLRTMRCSIKETVREAFTSMLSKITNYPKIFRQMCEYDPSPGLRRLHSLASTFSRQLNSEAEISHYRNLKIDLLKVKGNEFVKELTLRGVLECSVGERRHTMYMFDSGVYVFDSSLSLRGSSDLHTTDLVIYNRKLFLFSSSLESSISKSVARSSCRYLSVDILNKEAAREFYDAFYKAKLQGEKRGHACFRTGRHASTHCSGQEKEVLAGGCVEDPEILVTCLGTLDTDPKLYEVRIEEASFRTGGIMKLGHKEVHGEIEDFILSKRRSEALRMQDMSTVKILLESVDPAKIVPFLLNSYQEDDLPFDRKKAVFEGLCDSISNFSGPTKRTIGHISIPLDLSLFLYENDVLKTLNSTEIDYFSRLYLLLMDTSGCIGTVLAGRSLEDLVILYTMFIQRNVYALIHPDDLDRLSRGIERNIRCTESAMRPHSRAYLTKILKVCQDLDSRSHASLSRTILDVLFDGGMDAESLIRRINK